MTLTRWDPLDDLLSLRESMGKLFQDANMRGLRGSVPLGWLPAVEVFETDREVVVRAEIPDVDPKNMEVAVTKHTLTIKGETRAEKEEKGRNYHVRELRRGAFARSLTLPAVVLGDQAKASYEDGILEIHFPRSERATPKSVRVEIPVG